MNVFSLIYVFLMNERKEEVKAEPFDDIGPTNESSR